MSSSSGMYNPPLLIVGTNRVYAKGDDGAFYPGLIEGKNYGYTVQLANDKRKQVHEEDLVWLGFYGLPSSCWPENPVVQPTTSTEKTFEGTMKFVGNTPPTCPASFAVRRSNGENEQYSLERDEHESLQFLEGEKLPTQRLHARISEEQRVKQPRSSVIRLNRDLLHKETSYDRPMDRLMPSRPSMISLNETTNLIPGYAENKSELHNKYNTKISPLHYGESLCSTKVYAEDALRHPPKVNIPHGGERGRETTEHIRVNWRKTFSFNQSNLTPPTPTTYDSVISSSRGLSVFRTIHASVARAQSSIENTPLSSGVQTKKRRKRSDTKKCRKVYGIDNREAWCTQCKWKKACTQFKECDKKILDNCAQEDFGSEVSIGA